jgi:hypothetical protein
MAPKNKATVTAAADMRLTRAIVTIPRIYATPRNAGFKRRACRET